LWKAKATQGILSFQNWVVQNNKNTEMVKPQEILRALKNNEESYRRCIIASDTPASTCLLGHRNMWACLPLFYGYAQSLTL